MDHAAAVVEREHLEAMLVEASRTFAINIPMLPGILRDALGLGYLLLRNADTLEDAYRWPKDRRIRHLESLHGLVLQPDEAAGRAFIAQLEAATDLENPAHHRLLLETPYLLDQLVRLPEAYAHEVRIHVARVIRRMQAWVAQYDDASGLRLMRLQQLDDYCYSVAGIVGELVTSLIALYRPALGQTRLLFLRTLETGVGAGLQLTNILKDAFRDHLQGRYYIPASFLPLDGRGSQDVMRPIFAYAYRHLCLGIDYTCTLPEEEGDIRRAVLVPVLLAGATLVRLLERMEDLFEGLEVKISREEVAALLGLADEISDRNDAVRDAWRRISAPLSSLGISAG
jgi:farnesyl-diphosphate farnesyltransferase